MGVVELQPTISDYYRTALQHAMEEVESTPDDRLLGVDPDEWVDYLLAKFAMEPIAFDDARSQRMSEIEVEHTLRGYDIYTDAEAGTVIRKVAIRVEVPVLPTDTLGEIVHHGLSPNSFSLGTRYPDFDYDNRSGYIHITVGASPEEVNSGFERLQSSIRRYNDSIASETTAFRPQLARIVAATLNKVRDKHRKLDDLAAAVGIPLIRKVDVADVVP